MEKVKVRQSLKFWLSIFVVLLLIVYLVRYFYHIFYWVSFPFPIEYQEPNLINTIDGIKEGINPYNISKPHNYRYWYGPIYPYIVYCLDKFLFVHDCALTARGFSVFLLTLIAYFISISSKFLKNDIFNFLVIFTVLLPINYIDLEVTSRPDLLALFFVIFSIFWIYKSGEQFQYRIALSAFFMALTFFTKQYFILCFLIPLIKIANYRNQILYLIYFICFFLILSIFVLFKFPLAWSMFFFSFLGFTVTSWDKFTMELLLFSESFWHIIILAILQSTLNSKSWFSSKSKFTLTDNNFNFKISIPIITIIILLYIGRNDGYTRSYFLQLALPALVFIGFSKRISNSENVNLFVTVLLLAWMNISLHLGVNHFQNTRVLNLSENVENNVIISQLIDKSSQKKIYVLSPLVAQIITQNRKYFKENLILVNRGGLGGALKIRRNYNVDYSFFGYFTSYVNKLNNELYSFDSLILNNLNNEILSKRDNMIVISDHINDLSNSQKRLFNNISNYSIFIGRKKGYKIRVYSN